MKNTLQKKRKNDSKFVIASAGKSDKDSKSVALHANLSKSNDSDSLEIHYKGLLDKGLDAQKVELVVTDMLPAYSQVIERTFPNALHQFCIFHFIQHINKTLRTALKTHRYAHYEAGNRKEAHKIAWLLLKGQEKLSQEEREKILDFCIKHPQVAANYAFKEDLRAFYAQVETLSQAYAYKDIIIEYYQDKICPKMQQALLFFTTNFEKTIAYIRKEYPKDKTNNDAERMMRAIKKIQNTHYFLRNDNTYIRKIKVILNIQQPVAT